MLRVAFRRLSLFLYLWYIYRFHFHSCRCRCLCRNVCFLACSCSPFLFSLFSFFLCLVHHQEHIYLVFTNLLKTRTFFWKRNVSSPPTSTHATPDISRSESYSKNVSLQNSVKPMKVQKRPQAIFAWPPLTKYHEQ